MASLGGSSPWNIDSYHLNAGTKGSPDDDKNFHTLSGISTDGCYAWLACGSALEVVSIPKGDRLGAWTFGAALKDKDTVITSVVEFNQEVNDEVLGGLKKQILVASTTISTDGSLLSLFDVKTSRVVQVIEIPYKVTAVTPIHNIDMKQRPVTRLLSDHLKTFFGVVAVGCEGGHVLLVDMCLDMREHYSDEVQPFSLSFLDPRTRDAEAQRIAAGDRGRHLCLHLAEDSHNHGYFYYRKPDSSVIKTLVADDVYVTTMHFSKFTGSLTVGFNFGSFQIWKLDIPVLEYSSDYLEEEAICSIAFQEPENDPRNFSYLWISRGPLPHENIDDFTSYMTMYQLGYSHRHWMSGIGYVSKDLSSVYARFEMDLSSPSAGLLTSNKTQCGSRLITCKTLEENDSTLLTSNEESIDDGRLGVDLSRILIVWEVVGRHSKSTYHLAIFDINRWYHSQMPYSRSGPSHEICPYLSIRSVTEEAKDSLGKLLACALVPNTLSQFRNHLTPAPEQQFYPSSLSFNIWGVTKSTLLEARYQSLQMDILKRFFVEGSTCLLRPEDVYNWCTYAGLMIRPADLSSNSVPVTQKRWALMDVALHHEMSKFHQGCVMDWATGSLAASGCSLKMILDWAWTALSQHKDAAESIITSLFDWSGEALDDVSSNRLLHHDHCISSLFEILQHLHGVSDSVPCQGLDDIETRVQVCQLVRDRLKAISFFIAIRLLPEVGDPDQSGYFYPTEALHEITAHLRKQLTWRSQSLDLPHDLKCPDLLLIDGLIEVFGAGIKEAWDNDGGDGMYPPNSLQSLFQVYLLHDVSMEMKHILLLYLLYDLRSQAAEDKTSTQTTLPAYSNDFSSRIVAYIKNHLLPKNVIRLTEGFWLLDHQFYEEALKCLLDSSIDGKLEAWQSHRIIKSFLYAGQHSMALKFMLSRLASNTQQDIKLKVTVYMANKLIWLALEEQRSYSDEALATELLQQIFEGCQEMGTINSLLKLPLTADEDRRLVTYLQSNTKPEAQETLVMYHLTKRRIVDAIILHNKMKNEHKYDNSRSLARNAIVQGYHNILPEAEKAIANDPDLLSRGTWSRRKEVFKSKPLSAIMNKKYGSAKVISRSSLIRTVMSNVESINKSNIQNLSRVGEGSPVSPGCSPLFNASVPFIGTPSTPKNQSHNRVSSRLSFPQASSMSLKAPSLTSYGREQNLPYSRKYSPLTELEKGRIARYPNVAALSLLHTPKVLRLAPGQKRQTPIALPTSVQTTPHSILKVRSKSLLTPRKLGNGDVRSHKKLQPSPLVRSDLPEEFETPRQIRFDMPPTPSSGEDSSAFMADSTSQAPAESPSSLDNSPITGVNSNRTPRSGSPRVNFSGPSDITDIVETANVDRNSPDSTPEHVIPGELTPEGSVSDDNVSSKSLDVEKDCQAVHKEDRVAIREREATPVYTQESRLLRNDLAPEYLPSGQKEVDEDITFNFNASKLHGAVAEDEFVVTSTSQTLLLPSDDDKSPVSLDRTEDSVDERTEKQSLTYEERIEMVETSSRSQASDDPSFKEESEALSASSLGSKVVSEQSSHSINQQAVRQGIESDDNDATYSISDVSTSADYSASEVFTASDVFSKSDVFSASEVFSASDILSTSEVFSASDVNIAQSMSEKTEQSDANSPSSGAQNEDLIENTDLSSGIECNVEKKDSEILSSKGSAIEDTNVEIEVSKERSKDADINASLLQETLANVSNDSSTEDPDIEVDSTEILHGASSGTYKDCSFENEVISGEAIKEFPVMNEVVEDEENEVMEDVQVSKDCSAENDVMVVHATSKVSSIDNVVLDGHATKDSSVENELIDDEASKMCSVDNDKVVLDDHEPKDRSAEMDVPFAKDSSVENELIDDEASKMCSVDNDKVGLDDLDPKDCSAEMDIQVTKDSSVDNELIDDEASKMCSVDNDKVGLDHHENELIDDETSKVCSIDNEVVLDDHDEPKDCSVEMDVQVTKDSSVDNELIDDETSKVCSIDKDKVVLDNHDSKDCSVEMDVQVTKESSVENELIDDEASKVCSADNVVLEDHPTVQNNRTTQDYSVEIKAMDVQFTKESSNENEVLEDTASEVSVSSLGDSDRTKQTKDESALEFPVKSEVIHLASNTHAPSHLSKTNLDTSCSLDSYGDHSESVSVQGQDDSSTSLIMVVEQTEKPNVHDNVNKSESSVTTSSSREKEINKDYETENMNNNCEYPTDGDHSPSMLPSLRLARSPSPAGESTLVKDVSRSPSPSRRSARQKSPTKCNACIPQSTNRDLIHQDSDPNPIKECEEEMDDNQILLNEPMETAAVDGEIQSSNATLVPVKSSSSLNPVKIHDLDAPVVSTDDLEELSADKMIKEQDEVKEDSKSALSEKPSRRYSMRVAARRASESSPPRSPHRTSARRRASESSPPRSPHRTSARLASQDESHSSPPRMPSNPSSPARTPSRRKSPARTPSRRSKADKEVDKKKSGLECSPPKTPTRRQSIRLATGKTTPRRQSTRLADMINNVSPTSTVSHDSSPASSPPRPSSQRSSPARTPTRFSARLAADKEKKLSSDELQNDEVKENSKSQKSKRSSRGKGGSSRSIKPSIPSVIEEVEESSSPILLLPGTEPGQTPAEVPHKGAEHSLRMKDHFGRNRMRIFKKS